MDYYQNDYKNLTDESEFMVLVTLLNSLFLLYLQKLFITLQWKSMQNNKYDACMTRQLSQILTL